MRGEDILFPAVFLLIGLIFGDAYNNDKWEVDCKRLGKHLSSGVVYICSKEG